jgi:hypothetical protein
LPTEDKSYLIFNRNIKIDFTISFVEKVYSLNADGIYTAGDEIVIAV